jgi:predicted O-methyltransferase YrrM
MGSMPPDPYVPDARDLAYIEGLAQPVHPTLLEIERAARAETPRVPILSRAGGRVLAALAHGRRRILEVGTAFGYSTLWMALAQPPNGTIATIDPDTTRTGRARAWWREAGIADERITVVSSPALEALAAGDPALKGPFDLVFIDALKPEYLDYLEGFRQRLVRDALVVADNVLWSGRVARGGLGEDASTAALQRFNTAVLGDPAFSATILPVGDGLLLAAFRG